MGHWAESERKTRTKEKSKKLFTVSLQKNEAQLDVFTLPQVNVIRVYIQLVAFIRENANS